MNERKHTPQNFFKSSPLFSLEVENSYFKCRSVIKSCRTFEQLKNARRYVELWKVKYPTFTVFYNRLNELLYKQELDITYIIKLRNRNVKRRILPN